MNYRSIEDLSACIRNNLHKIPKDIELVVGVPRSGMLAASIISLHLNVKLTMLESFIEDIELPAENTRQHMSPGFTKPSEARHVLVVDDSIATGESMQRVRSSVLQANRNQRVSFCAVYSEKKSKNVVDIYFEEVATPRSFEWNTLHRPLVGKCCVDMDGVLCMDPTNSENDDGVHYKNFLRETKPIVLPSYPVGHVVSSRLEKYRNETEEWLERHGIVYGQLHLLDLPDAATRRRLACHASFKAEVFRNIHDSILFIESEPAQAKEIARLSGKPALCFRTQELYHPGASYRSVSFRAMQAKERYIVRARRVIKRIKNKK